MRFTTDEQEEVFGGYKIEYKDDKNILDRVSGHRDRGLIFDWYTDNLKKNFYYEMKVTKGNGRILIGILPSCEAVLAGWRGPSDKDWGLLYFYSPSPNSKAIIYDTETQNVCHDSSLITSSEQYAVGNVVGCGIKSGHQGCVYFTVNGKKMDEVIKYHGCQGVFPMVQIIGGGTEIEINFGDRKFLFDPDAADPSRIPISQSFSEEWTKHIDCVSELTENLILDHLMDVKIITKDGGELRCHGLILSIRSPVFKTMLEPEKNLDNTINIVDFDTSTIKKMLAYLYSDKIEDSEINMDLLALSNMFQVESLQSLCEKKMCAMLTNENVMDAWMGANLLKRAVLLEACEKYLETQWSDVKKTESFEMAMKSNPEDIASLVIKMLDKLIILRQNP